MLFLISHLISSYANLSPAEKILISHGTWNLVEYHQCCRFVSAGFWLLLCLPDYCMLLTASVKHTKLLKSYNRIFWWRKNYKQLHYKVKDLSVLHVNKSEKSDFCWNDNICSLETILTVQMLLLLTAGITWIQ